MTGAVLIAFMNALQDNFDIGFRSSNTKHVLCMPSSTDGLMQTCSECGKSLRFASIILRNNLHMAYHDTP